MWANRLFGISTTTFTFLCILFSCSYNELVSASNNADQFNTCWVTPLNNNQPGSVISYDPSCCASLTMQDIDLLNGMYSNKGMSFFPGMNCLSQFVRPISISWLSNMFVDNPTLAIAVLKNIPVQPNTSAPYSFYPEWSQVMKQNPNLTINVDQLDLRIVVQAQDLDEYLCQANGQYNDSTCILGQSDLDIISRNTYMHGLCPLLSNSTIPGYSSIAANETSSPQIYASDSNTTVYSTSDGSVSTMSTSSIQVPYFPPEYAGQYERILSSIKPQCFAQFPSDVQQNLGGLYITLHLNKSGMSIPPETINNLTTTGTFDIFSTLSQFFHYNFSNTSNCPGTIGQDGVMTVQVVSTILANTTTPQTICMNSSTIAPPSTSTITASNATSHCSTVTSISTVTINASNCSCSSSNANTTSGCSIITITNGPSSYSPTCSIITITSNATNTSSSTPCTVNNSSSSTSSSSTPCTTLIVYPGTNITSTVTGSNASSIATTPSTTGIVCNTYTTTYSNIVSTTNVTTVTTSPTNSNSNSTCGQLVNVITDTIYQNRTEEQQLCNCTSQDMEQLLNQGVPSSASYTSLHLSTFIITLMALIIG